jgi:hypothetical protein
MKPRRLLLCIQKFLGLILSLDACSFLGFPQPLYADPMMAIKGKERTLVLPPFPSTFKIVLPFDVT